ncbi:hypothetical protein ABZZ22_01960, partial [Nocardioides sp. NPDC006273]
MGRRYRSLSSAARARRLRAESAHPHASLASLRSKAPSWARVKTEWRSESVGWFDDLQGGALVGAAL